MDHHHQPGMRGTLNLALVLLSLSSAKAQSWCPPGATWTSSAGIGLGGHSQYTYAADTLLDGFAAQRIDLELVEQLPPDYVYTITSHYSAALITRSDSDVVFLWSGVQNAWDTLFWFGALPGQGWGMPFDPVCDSLQIVHDTTTVFVQGVPLRAVINNNQPGMVVERMGAESIMAFPSPCIIWEGPHGIRCYSDAEISYTAPWWNFGCVSLNGIDDRSTPTLALFPNPGTDHFDLELPSGVHTIEVFNAMGQGMLYARSTTGIMTVNTGSLTKGIYFVRVDGGQTVRWVKQ